MPRKKIVIIDDEVDLCHLLRTYFEDLDHEVHLAYNLASGMVLLNDVTPDVLFIDNNLPDGLGWEKLKYLLEKFPNSKINLISAYHTVPDEMIAQHGNIRILEKPLRLNTLRDYL
jgi:DNA-binding NtrC family response regulator